MQKTTLLPSLIAFLLLLIGSSCTSITQREYSPFIRDLDGRNELKISTYPAVFPKGKSGSTLLLDKEESHGETYFQVYIRDSSKKMGPNPHVESIEIHSFSYQIDSGPKTELLSGYTHNFWMQGNPRYEKRKLPPIPYRSDSMISIEIDFTLNGKKYTYQGEMKPQEQTTVIPTAVRNSTI